MQYTMINRFVFSFCAYSDKESKRSHRNDSGKNRCVCCRLLNASDEIVVVSMVMTLTHFPLEMKENFT